MTRLQDFDALFRPYWWCGPQTHNRKLIEIECKSEFEPHGRASETWEPIWYLRLLPFKHHSRSTTGWRVGTVDNPITFKGRTLDEALMRAIQFLKECEHPVLRYSWGKHETSE